MKCRKNRESRNAEVARTKYGRIMFLSKCAVHDSKKSKFMKEQEGRGLLSTLTETPILSDLPIADILF